MKPDVIAQHYPDKPAAILAGSAAVRDFSTLALRSELISKAMANAGLMPRDHVALLLENRLEYFDVGWAAQRTGLYYTPLNWHLKSEEVTHVLQDSGARWLFVSAALLPLINVELCPLLERVVVVDGPGPDGLDALLSQAPRGLLVDEREGQAMYYSSGTTGRPKGIKRALNVSRFGTTPAWEEMLTVPYEIDAETVYLCPAPLYHAAPLGWSMAIQRCGGTIVLMERFDPLEALRLMEKYGVTHVQMVPTHFVQMLKLPEAQRNAFDLSSLKIAVHAAAPCPVEVKEQMMAWWGPIIHEYYAFSEGSGFTRIGPQDWLTHKGSVGQATMGTIHILDEQGQDQPTGETGVIWFEGGIDFDYHNDPDRTAAVHDARGRSSVGDMGYLDSAGYLYLTDRQFHMIISGGVNIYPQEVENLLVMHPAVSDVAVIGVPDPDYGEAVKAVVVTAPGVCADDDLAQALMDYCRACLSHFKCPKSVDFVDALPRLPTGKLLKRNLRQRYL